MIMNKNLLFLLALLLSTNASALKLDRVILASDANPTYLQFWPLVARAWKQLIGVQPTLILIADESVQVDETLGDVIRLKPIEGVSTATYAQCVRLLAPAYYENEVCIISDIDMLPISREYFCDSIKDFSDSTFVVYRDKAYGENSKRFPMCYNAGKGRLFKSIFRFSSVDDIPRLVQKWVEMGLGWNTDEIMLLAYVRNWPYMKDHCAFLGHTSMESRRIDRANWRYSKTRLGNYYIDAHMVRPLDAYYDEIKALADDLGLIL